MSLSRRKKSTSERVSIWQVLACLLLLSSLGSAPTKADEHTQSPESETDQFLEQFLNDPDSSVREPEASPDEPTRTVRINLVEILQQARQARVDGELEKAARLYRLILHFQPNIDYVRIELAYTLTLIGERAEAQSLLSEMDLSRIDPRILAFIIGRPRQRLSFYVLPEFLMDSNRNQQTAARTITTPLGESGTLSSDARAQSGFGGRLLVGAIFSEELLEGIDLTVLASFRSEWFENRDFDEIQPFLEVEFSRRFDRWQPSIAALGSYTRVGHDSQDEGAIGGSLRLLYQGQEFNTRSTVTTRYFTGYRNSRNITDRRLIELRQTVNFGLFESLSIGLSSNVSLTNWDERETQDNVTFSPGLRVTPVILPWIRPTFHISWRRRWNDRRDPFFQVIRIDDQLRTGIELCLNDDVTFETTEGTLGWLLQNLTKLCVRYNYTRNWSNIDLFDYSRHEYGLRFQPLTW